ncbi:MAG: hypothetical protein Q7S81_02030 [bacterium]|nr:hypothetical protein [bacterium]
MSNKLSEIIFSAETVLSAKKREIVLFLIFFFIASLSFGLGYLYAKDQGVAPIIIEKKC